MAARRGSPKGDHDVVNPSVTSRITQKVSADAMRRCGEGLRAKIVAVMRRLTPENRVPAVMSDRELRKRLEGRDERERSSEEGRDP